jgi:divalent metal cation (Fe/Co/Zn/Cd) transporter
LELGLPYLDGAASIVIGLLLCVVAVLMVYESKGLLIGEGLDRETLKSARALVEADPAVERVQHLHTLYLGAHEVLLTIELRFRSTISALEVRQSVTRIRQEIRAQHPDVTRVFFGAESISGGDDSA